MSSPYETLFPAPTSGETIAAIHHQMTVCLDRMTAFGLSDLKAALDAASSGKDAVVKDYRTKYKGFRERWWCEHQLVAKLHQALTCTYEKDAWREIAQKCVCRLQRNIWERTEEINAKNDCSRGELERDAARAQAERDRAKSHKDAWTAAAATIDAQITANDALAKAIQTLIGNGDPQAIYQFWFLLLPAHRALMPDDAPASARELGHGESPEDICGFSSHGHRTPPWLIEPDRFGHVLDEAWEAYCNAQIHYARVQAAYQERKDDLATLTAKRDALKAALAANITACLKEHAPHGACCTETPAAPAAPAAPATKK